MLNNKKSGRTSAVQSPRRISRNSVVINGKPGTGRNRYGKKRGTQRAVPTIIILAILAATGIFGYILNDEYENRQKAEAARKKKEAIRHIRQEIENQCVEAENTKWDRTEEKVRKCVLDGEVNIGIELLEAFKEETTNASLLRQADRDIRRLKMSKERQITRIKSELVMRANAFTAANKPIKAAQVFLGYSGKYAEETLTWREKMGNEYQCPEDEMTIGKTAAGEVSYQVVESMLEGKWEKALDKYSEETCGTLFKILIREAGEIEKRVLASMKSCIGKTLRMFIGNRKIKLRLLDLNKKMIIFEELVSKGWIKREYSLNNVSLKEFIKRIPSDASFPAKHVYVAAQAASRNQYGITVKNLNKIGEDYCSLKKKLAVFLVKNVIDHAKLKIKSSDVAKLEYADLSEEQAENLISSAKEYLETGKGKYLKSIINLLREILSENTSARMF